jgi:hypothetical protein
MGQGIDDRGMQLPVPAGRDADRIPA